jgi:GDP-L-fucose synthase
MVGSALVRSFNKNKKYKVITTTRKDLDLLSQQKTFNFIKKNKPDLIIDAAARVGGIMANNTFRTEFLYQNLQIQNNLIYSALKNDIKNFIFLGSSCIYPRLAKQPIKEEYLLSSALEKTNEPYAIAKIAGLKLCESIRNQYNKNYISLMPTNLYGPGDNYDLNDAHVIPALIKKIHLAKINDSKTIVLWGTGKPLRDFLYVEDLSSACKFVMNNKIKESLINIGSGKEISIKNIAYLLCEIIEYKGKIVFDKSKPNGSPRKIIDNTVISSYGWKPKYSLKEGLKLTYKSFLNNDGRNI